MSEMRSADRPSTDQPVDPVAKDAPEAAAQAAPGGSVAATARRFGDRFPEFTQTWLIRADGIAVLVLAALYLPWCFTHMSDAHPWLAAAFATASATSVVSLLVSVINSWSSRVTSPRRLEGDDVPAVAVVVPTFGEPIPEVLRTLMSVLAQDYPKDRLIVVVSDDGHDPMLARAVRRLGVHYHEPSPRFASPRNGAGKSGNLNSAVAFVRSIAPSVRYLETRDAGDELGSAQFLREVVGQLESDDGLAFVQTIKEAQVSAGDPFSNFGGAVYRRQMLSQNAAGAVFPCGSGVVWRQVALEQIGLFPTWNLAEDLTSGVEALRNGWRSCYLPIVGAVAQRSPEDVASISKRRGTRAIDTARLMVWGKLKGLSRRQRLQLEEMSLYHLYAVTVPLWVVCGALACVGTLPFDASPASWAEHLLPFAVVTELRLWVLGIPFGDRRRTVRQPFRAYWRSRVMWIGLAPVYILAYAKAIAYGPRRRPLYKVARRRGRSQRHWRVTLPQAVLASLLPIGLVCGAALGRLPSPLILISAGFWGLVSTLALANFAALGWRRVPAPAWDGVERRSPERLLADARRARGEAGASTERRPATGPAV
jgi:cellulose synthase (UDP-forming)